MTMNIHLLLHLWEAIQLYDPLWMTSSYAFKNLNSVLKRFVHSLKKPELQIHIAVSVY